MKKLLLVLCTMATLFACVHSDKTKEKTAMSMSMAAADLCPYDSAGKTPVRDTTVQVKDSVFKTTTVIDTVDWKRANWFLRLFGIDKVPVTEERTFEEWVYSTKSVPGKTTPRDTIYIAYKPCVVEPPVVTSTWFGAKIQQAPFADQLSVAKQLGLTCIRPNSLQIKGFNGELGNAVQWKQNGFKVVQTWNWIDDKSQKPYTILRAQDTLQFIADFTKACIAAQGIVDVIVLENEVTNIGGGQTNGYYIWNDSAAANYLRELRIATAIAHKYNLKIADGSIPLEVVEQIMNADGKAIDDRSVRVLSLLNGYKLIRFDFVNFHHHYKVSAKNPTGYPVKNLPETIKWLENYTGHKAVCNEYSSEQAFLDVYLWTVDGHRDAGLYFSIIWSGDGGTESGKNSKGDPLNTGTKLSDGGVYYRDAIK